MEKNIYGAAQKNSFFDRELQEAVRLRLQYFFCSCRDCHGGKRVSVAGIREHLRRVRRDPFLMWSMLGGDPEAGYPEIGAWGDSDVSRSTEDQTEMADSFPS